MSTSRESRELVNMAFNEELLHQASRIVHSVALCLADYVDSGVPIDSSECSELSGQLELEVHVIRDVNGGRA